MIKTVIFDIGNVLVDFCWEPFFRSFGFSEEVVSRIASATVKSPDWAELDRGVLTEEEVISRFVKNAPEQEEEIRQIMENVNGILHLREYAIPWIQELKAKGYQVLVLSNLYNKVERECPEDMVFLKETDGGILSYQEKLIKPMPAIYWTLLERYELKAEECVFIDDSAENIAAAEKMGIHGIVFKTREQVVGELENLGVKLRNTFTEKTVFESIMTGIEEAIQEETIPG